VKQSLRLGLAGGLGGLIAWLVSEPFAKTAAVNGTHVGSMYFTLGSFFGWFAHAMLGALIVSFLAIAVNLDRMSPSRASLMGLLGFVLGGFLGWISDATSDRLMISFLRAQGSNAGIDIGMGFIWNFLVAMSLALGVFLCCQPTMARLGRMIVGGLAAAVLGFIAEMVLAPVSIVIMLMTSRNSNITDQVWRSFDPTRLANDIVMGFVFGFAIGIAENLMTSGSLRLVLSRNEGRDFRLGSGVNRIGSAEGIEVRIPDRAVAPVHAHVFNQSGQYVVQDLGQPGGTLINGQPVQHAPLRPGDTVQIGTYTLFFSAKGQAAPPPGAWTPPQYYAPQVPNAPPPTIKSVKHRLTDSFATTTELAEGINEIGRDPGLAVSLPYETSVSRHHARITVRGACAFLDDLGSTNGTRINGDPLFSERELAEGDVISVGRASLTYHQH
jgi:pSer/pThr/pTyr-binding forkhead associated (FHA) protein